jgi:hypothetical protein
MLLHGRAPVADVVSVGPHDQDWLVPILVESRASRK